MMDSPIYSFLKKWGIENLRYLADKRICCDRNVSSKTEHPCCVKTVMMKNLNGSLCADSDYLSLPQPWQLLQSPPQPQLQRDFPAFLLRIRERIMHPTPINKIAATTIVPIFAWIQENISRPLLSYAWAEALAGLNS